MAPAATANVLPFAMLMGWPVHEPNHQRMGVPAVSHSSSPTMDHVLPEAFVHVSAVVLLAAPADADVQAVVVPPVV